MADAAPVFAAAVAEAVEEPLVAAAAEAELDTMEDGAVKMVEFVETTGTRVGAVIEEPVPDDIPDAAPVLDALAVADEARDAAEDETEATAAAADVEAEETADDTDAADVVAAEPEPVDI